MSKISLKYLAVSLEKRRRRSKWHSASASGWGQIPTRPDPKRAMVPTLPQRIPFWSRAAPAPRNEAQRRAALIKTPVVPLGVDRFGPIRRHPRSLQRPRHRYRGDPRRRSPRLLHVCGNPSGVVPVLPSGRQLLRRSATPPSLRSRATRSPRSVRGRRRRRGSPSFPAVVAASCRF
jgi:hypothetical protein